MLAISHCSTHPSREAAVRCSSCGRWLCNRCARTSADRVFCSGRCRMRHGLGALARSIAARLRRRLEPAWSLAVVAGAAALLLAGVGRLVAELVEVSALVAAADRTRQGAAPAVIAELRPVPAGWRLELAGPAGGTVLVTVEGGQAVAVTLDRRGRGALDGFRLPGGISSVSVSLLAEPSITVAAAITPTPQPSPTPRPPPPPKPTPTATATSPPPMSPTRPSLPLPPPSAPSPAELNVARSAAEQRAQRSAPPVLHLVTDAGPKIALTFDGGESANGTADLLDVLAGLDLKVTIFVTGEFIEAHPGLVRRASLAGHELGNHTYSHSHLTSYAADGRHELLDQVTREWLHDELRRTEEAFLAATGRRLAPLWRAPYGEETARLRDWALELGYLHVRWSSLRGASLDALDWVDDEHSPLYGEANQIVDRLLAFPNLEGGIVLMHLSSVRPDPPWRELPRFVAGLNERNLQPVTVGSLLAGSKSWRRWLERATRRHRELFPRVADSGD